MCTRKEKKNKVQQLQSITPCTSKAYFVSQRNFRPPYLPERVSHDKVTLLNFFALLFRVHLQDKLWRDNSAELNEVNTLTGV